MKRVFLCMVLICLGLRAMDVRELKRDSRVSLFNERVTAWNAQGNKGFFKIFAYFLGMRGFERDYQAFKKLREDAEVLKQEGQEVEGPTCFHWDFLCMFVPHGIEKNQ